MAGSGFKRRLKLIALAAAVVLVLLVVLAPVWSPWVARPVLKHLGVRYSTHDRVGWSTLVLKEVRFVGDGVRAEADWIECPQPIVWLWHGWAGYGGKGGDEPEPLLEAGGWSVEIGDGVEADRDGSKITSVLQAWQKVEEQMRTLRRWLPVAHLEEGVLQVADERILCPTLTFNRGRAQGVLISERLGVTNVVATDLSRRGSATLRIEAEPAGVMASVNVQERESRLLVEGSVNWRENRVGFEAQFGDEGFLPTQGSIRGEDLRIPAELVRLRQYEAIRGEIDGRWDGSDARVEVVARADPLEDAASLPPLELVLAFAGDTNSFRLDQAFVRVPGLDGGLTDPVRMTYAGELLSDRAVVEADVDLSQQTWGDLSGRLNVRAVMTSLETNEARVVFTVEGTNIVGFDIEVDSIEVEGEFVDMRLQIDEAMVVLAGDSRGRLSGAFDFSTQRIEGAAVFFSGDYLRRFMGTNWSHDGLELSAELDGPWRQPNHSGELHLTNFSGGRLPAADGRLSWTGEGTVVRSFESQVRSAAGELELRGSAAWLTNQATLRLNNGVVLPVTGPACELVGPADFTVRRVGDADRPNGVSWEVAVTNFMWAGGRGRLVLEGEVNWPHSGWLMVGVRGAASAPLAPLLPEGASIRRVDWKVDEAEMAARWDRGPIQFTNRVTAGIEITNYPTADFTLEMTGDANGVAVNEFVIRDAEGEVLTASGAVPLALVPTPNGVRIEANMSAPLNAVAQMREGEALWETVVRLTGVRPIRPRLDLELEGTLTDPRGQMTMGADAIELSFDAQSTNTWPAISDLEVVLVSSDKTLRAETVSMLVEGQRLEGSFEFPLPSDSWGQIARGEGLADYWRGVSGTFSMEEASVSAFARYLPKILLPQGTVRADLTVKPGPRVEGEVVVREVATRPMEPLGAIRDVEVNLVFSGWEAEIKSLKGELGGQTASVTGRVNWRDWNDPVWNIGLKGRKIPLVRKPGLIVRSDLDLQVERKAGKTALVSGAVTLRDSYYLSDLGSLIPGQVSVPHRRPPYFSVTEDPYGDYRLDVALRGEEAIRVRTPLFHGQVSLDLHLQGTLAEPFTVGEVTIDSGQVVFPFARVGIDQGQVFLTSENPYRPQLFIVGNSRTLGYEVTVQITGPVDDPVWEMASSPPLSTEAIVLMLTAGEVPREDFEYTQGQRAGKLALFLGRNLLSSLTMSENPEERLIIRTGESVTEDGQETYSIEYKLTETVSVVGEYDRFGEVNAGLKWRVYSK